MSKSRAVLAPFAFSVVIVTGLLFSVQVSWAAVPETITVQGTLEAPGGGPLTGTYLSAVRIWDASVGGNLLANSYNPITLSDSGRFTLELLLEDVFVPPFQAWYDLAVDTDGDGIEEEEFFPQRVRFHSVPFARVAANAEQLGGQPASVFVQSGSLSTEVWRLDGNATGTGNFLGTTNDQPVELRVDNQRALVLIPTGDSPNLVGGHGSNSVGASVEGGAIGGGGASSAPNEVAGNYGTVGGGRNNSSQGQDSTVSGGQSNQALGSIATVGGGDSNIATNDADTVSGGQGNLASGGGATIGGGGGNQASALFAAVGGGGLSNFGDPLSGNQVSSSYGTIAGGGNNSAEGEYSSIAGGGSNTSLGSYSAVGGGSENRAEGEYSGVSGGDSNTALGDHSSVGGGVGNSALGMWNAVSGGSNNSATGDYSCVGGGYINQVQSAYSTIAGGYDNMIQSNSPGSVIGGGRQNRSEADYAAVGGGFGNIANAKYATIAGGGRINQADPNTGNRATGNYGTIGGGGGNQAGDNSGETFTAIYATVSGGRENIASGPYGAVGGGADNKATGGGAAVAGGSTNEASGELSAISGGDHNKAGGNDAAISGGFQNKANGNHAAIGGGIYNQAGGAYSVVPGGSTNWASGDYSFAAGHYAKAYGAGSFVWGDSTANNINAWGDNEFVARATGGFWFITAIDGNGVPTEGMRLPAGSSKWVPIGTPPPKANLGDSDPLQALQQENAELRQRVEDLEARLAGMEKLISGEAKEE